MRVAGKKVKAPPFYGWGSRSTEGSAKSLWAGWSSVGLNLPLNVPSHTFPVSMSYAWVCLTQVKLSLLRLDGEALHALEVFGPVGWVGVDIEGELLGLLHGLAPIPDDALPDARHDCGAEGAGR